MRALRWVPACLPLLLAAAAQSPAFEVISVKPNNTDDFRTMRMQVFPGGRFSATALPLLALLAYAYNLPVNPSERLSGVPDWVIRERFDIAAKAPEGAFPAGMPTSEARAKMQAMLQALLVDRFKLVMRRETKDIPMYALTVTNGGPKLQGSNTKEEDCPLGPTDGVSCHQFMGGQGRGLHAKAVTMQDLAGYIENWTDHPVVDRTRLIGLFAVDTEGWTPMRLPPPPPPGPAAPNPGAPPSGDGDMSDPTRPTLVMVLRRLVRRSTVIDMLGLLTLDFPKLWAWQIEPSRFHQSDFQRLRDSGISIFHPAVGYIAGDVYANTLRDVTQWNTFIATHERQFLRVDCPADLECVKTQRKIGIVVGQQNSGHFRCVEDVDRFHGLGQRVSQLTYCGNRIGGGSSDA